MRFERFFERGQSSQCWEWTGSIRTDTGYGRFGWSHGDVWGAHRAAYVLHYGPIPAGLVVDHICRNRRCVNPGHLRLLTSGENVLAGVGPSATNARKTHCIHGHELAGDNLYVHATGARDCRVCRIAAKRRHYAKTYKSKAARAAAAEQSNVIP